MRASRHLEMLGADATPRRRTGVYHLVFWSPWAGSKSLPGRLVDRRFSRAIQPMAVVDAPDRPLRRVRRELHTRGLLSLVHDRWTATTFVSQKVRTIAERINGAATCDDDAVSPAQLFEHAGGRVGGRTDRRGMQGEECAGRVVP